MSESTASAAAADQEAAAGKNQEWAFDVDGTTYRHDHPFVTGGEIMDLAGIPREQGLVLCHDDGTQESISADQKVRLVPKPQFRLRQSL